MDINPSVDFLFDCGLVGPEDVSTEQDLPRTMRKVRAGAAVPTEKEWRSSRCGAVETNLTGNLEVADSIPGLTQWVKDPVLP